MSETVQASDVPNIIFFQKKLANFFAKTLSIYFSYLFYKIIIKNFECPMSIRNYKKKQVVFCPPSAQQTSVLCCRLSDFIANCLQKTIIKQDVSLKPTFENGTNVKSALSSTPIDLLKRSMRPIEFAGVKTEGGFVKFLEFFETLHE